MAKKKKSRKKAVKQTAQHALPDGFWAQVGAVFLIAISILFVVAWFGAGGPVLEWIHMAAQSAIGYAVYVVPLLFIYIAVEIFRAEDNRLPFVVKLATVLMIVWFAGLFGLMQQADGVNTGGAVGDIANSAMLALVNSGVAAFLYVLLIAITTLFVLSISPITVIQSLWEMMRRDTSEQDANVKVMRKAAAAEKPERPAKAMAELKLNAGVPMLSAEEIANKEK